MFDLVLMLYLLNCWPFSGSALVLDHASKKAKKQQGQVGLIGSGIFPKNLIFVHCYDSHEHEKWYSTSKICVISDLKKKKFLLKRK